MTKISSRAVDDYIFKIRLITEMWINQVKSRVPNMGKENVNVNYMAGAERKITAGRSVFTSLKVQ